MRDLLLVVQIAICAVLVTSSMVAVRGLVRSLDSNFGFEPRNAMLVDTDLAMAGYSDDQCPAMQKRMIDAMETIPGVTSVGLTSAPPLDQAWHERRTVFTDETPICGRRMPPPYHRVQDISRILPRGRHSLLAGRSFTWHDDKDAPRVAVVNQEFARQNIRLRQRTRWADITRCGMERASRWWALSKTESI